MSQKAATALTDALNTVDKVEAEGRASLLSIAEGILGEAQPEGNPEADAEGQALSNPDPPIEPEAVPPEEDEAAQPETEPEAETETPEEGQPEPVKPEITPEVQQIINQRIGREVAKTKLERQRAEELSVRVRELETQIEARPIQLDSDNPLGHIFTHDALKREAEKAEATVEYAEELLADVDLAPEAVESKLKANKVVVTNAAGQEDWTPEAMKRTLGIIRRNAGKMVKAAGKREVYLTETRRWEQEAVKLVPELKDQESPRFQKWLEVVKSAPEIKLDPRWPFRAGVYVLGLEKLEEMAKVKPKAVAKPPRVPSTRTTQATAAKPSANNQELLGKIADGDSESRVEYIQSLLDQK